VLLEANPCQGPPPPVVADQALGLRRLCAVRGASMLPVIAAEGERPGAAALALARAVNAAGRRCLVIDATRGDVSRTLGVAARYELCHVAAGERSLADVVLEAVPGLAVLPASRGFVALTRTPRPAANLARIADALGLAGDWILIAAEAAAAESVAALAPGAELALACRAGTSGRTAAYALMKRLAGTGAAGGFRLLVSSHARAAQAGRELASVAERFLHLPVRFAAALPRTDVQALAIDLSHWRCARLAPPFAARPA
jgi:MinD-like ATPase involved in chromosome partitioning or flagellar assembly